MRWVCMLEIKKSMKLAFSQLQFVAPISYYHIINSIMLLHTVPTLTFILLDNKAQ